jgi:SAM-dependent methyltransferase
MKYVSCNYCQSDDTHFVTHGPDLFLNLPGDFVLVRCNTCGLIYQNPQLTRRELEPHYPELYEPYKKNPDDESSLVRRFDIQYGINRRCRQLINYHPHPGKILDIGCATGLFLKTISDFGWQATGIEPSDYASEYARKTFNLDVKTGVLEDFCIPTDEFDVVTMWDVLEHVPDPRMTLTEVARVLKPGGLLALSLPNPTCPEAQIFGDSWIGWDRPRHLYLFTPKVLQRYLSDAGFGTMSLESLGGRLGLTLLSFEMYLKAKGVSEKKGRQIRDLLNNWPFRIGSWPIYKLGELTNRTTVMNVFVRLSNPLNITSEH